MRVIALEHAVAAPICSRHLADLGADVIKIERPGDGDFARGYDSAVHGQSSFFLWLNRGKRSVTLDVSKTRHAMHCRSWSMARTCCCRTWHRAPRHASVSV